MDEILRNLYFIISKNHFEHFQWPFSRSNYKSPMTNAQKLFQIMFHFQSKKFMRTKWKFTVSYVPLTFIRSFCCLLLVPKLILTIKKKFFFSVAFLPTKQLKILRKTLPYKFKASFYFFFSLILFVYSFCFFSDTCEMFVFSSFLFRNCNNDNFYSAFGDAITKLMILSLSFSISFLPNSDRFLVPWNFWWHENSVFRNYGLKESKRCLEFWV